MKLKTERLILRQWEKTDSAPFAKMNTEKCTKSWRDQLIGYQFTELNELNTEISAAYPLKDWNLML